MGRAVNAVSLSLSLSLSLSGRARARVCGPKVIMRPLLCDFDLRLLGLKNIDSC